MNGNGKGEVVKLTTGEVVKMLEGEIKWCMENYNDKLSNDYQAGFVNGVRQALNLVKRAEEELKK